ncbi:hypothetical protein BsWGS_00990 [Bradybaena similaris]
MMAVLSCSTIVIVTMQFLASRADTLTWDSASETWLDFYKSYCGRACQNGSLVTNSSLQCQQPACFECDCDPTCVVYGTCCPPFDSTIGITISNASSREYTDDSHMMTLSLQDRFYCNTFPGFEKYYYMISDCSQEYLQNIEQEQSNSSLKHANSFRNSEQIISVSKRCVDSKMDTLDDVTPYIDLQYGITFKNKFCAICNGYLIENNRFINDETGLEGDRQPTILEDAAAPFKYIVSAWTLNVSCSHYQNLFHITSEYELFKSALELSTEQCRVVYTQPNTTARAKTCDPKFHEVTKTKCSSSDSSLQGHCLGLRHKFLLVHGGQTIFCYICSGGKLSVNQCSRKTPLIPIIIFQTLDRDVSGIRSDYVFKLPTQVTRLSLLLGATQPKLYVTPNLNAKCNASSEWRSTEGECKPVYCTAGKLVEEGGLCSTALNQVGGLGYTLFMVLIPESLNVCVSKLHLRLLTNKIITDLSEISRERHIEVKTRVLSRSLGIKEEIVLQKVFVTANLISYFEDNRDEFENKILRLARDGWVMEASSAGNTTVRLITTALGKGFKPLFHDEINQSVTEYLSAAADAKIPEDYHCSLSDTVASNTTNGKHTSPFLVKLYEKFDFYYGTSFHQWQYKYKFIDITNSLTCQYVALNVTDILISNTSVLVNFSYNNMNFTVPSTTNISLLNGEIHICFDFFNSLTYVADVMPDTSDLTLATHYLEFICTCLSVVCLLMSFVTYSLFPVLRTLPGLNNMCLIISLALAQIFLFITAEIGFAGALHPDYCLFHAVSLHYFWLATFMWMNVCCIHMYRVFTCHGTKFINTGRDTRRHLHYCLFAFGSPVVFIIFYVVICLWLTSGSSNGYSNTYCFLDVTMSILTTLLSLVAPLTLTILTNGVLFVLTIREMVHVPRVRSTAAGRGVMTYVKLSTLTGVSYIVCGAALHLQSPIVNLFAAPVMSLQGVFIFISFICNTRVGKLFREKLMPYRSSSYSDSRTKETRITYNSASRPEFKPESLQLM